MKKIIPFFLALIIISSCKKEEDTGQPPILNDGNNNVAITINSPNQVWMKIDGVYYRKIANSTTIESVVSAHKNLVPAPDTSTASYENYLEDISSGFGIPLFSVRKGHLEFVGNYPAEEEFRALFSQGTYSYNPDAINGVVIKYYDENGNAWSTGEGSANQSGSTFVIEETKESNTGYQNIKIKASFNCKVYNNSGQVKTITEGIFVGDFENN